MRTLGIAIVASLALAIGAGATNAAEAPATAAKTTNIAGMSSIQLPSTEKGSKPAKIVVAKRGRKVVTGLAIGALIVGAAVLASKEARAERRRARRHRSNCRRWERQCNRGNDRSCWRYDNNC